MELCILIPAHNEETSLAKTVAHFDEFLAPIVFFNILVINDHSNDNTFTVLRELKKKYPNFSFFNNEKASGVGNAIRFGLEKWKGDIIAICMADGSDSPMDILKSYYKIVDEGYNCVFGSRFIRKGDVNGYPLKKLILNRVFNFFVKLFTRINYNDFTNIFKVYHRSAIQTISPIEATGFNIGLEMSLKAFKNNLKIAIVPISWRQRSNGMSKLNIRKNIKLYISTLIKHLTDA